MSATGSLDDRALALAGVLQALMTANHFAHKGILDSDRETVANFQTAVRSLFEFRPASAEAAFGGAVNLRRGIEALRDFGIEELDSALFEMSRDVIQVARQLLKKPHLLEALREGLLVLRPADDLALVGDGGAIFEGVDQLYTKTISTLPQRLRLRGEPAQLRQPAVVHRLRTLLMAAVRAAVLWRQCGGSLLSIIFERRALHRAAGELLKQLPADGLAR